MKQKLLNLIAVSILLFIATVLIIFINNQAAKTLNKEAELRDSVRMYRDCCLRCNTEILESNNNFTNGK